MNGLLKHNQRRPLGITILAIWALVGSGVAIEQGIVELTKYQGSLSGVFQLLSSIVVPLGASYTALNGYISIIFGIALAAIGTFTLKGGKRVWTANVGISILALASLAYASYPFLYNISQSDYSTSLADLDNQTTRVIMIVSFAAMIAVSTIRLHYLLRRNTKNFFNNVPQQALASDAK